MNKIELLPFASLRRPWLVVLALVLASALVAIGTFSSPAGAAATPPCPEGSTYNSTTRMCEAPATEVCPAGTSPFVGYGPDRCSGPVEVSCPEGYTYISHGDGSCEDLEGDYSPPVEPTGEYCPDPEDTTCTPPSCPEGYTYVEDDHMCEDREGDFSPEVEPTYGACPEGTTLQFWPSARCDAPMTYSCPSGFTLNTSNAPYSYYCEAPPGRVAPERRPSRPR